FNHSMNYRSVVLFGKGELIEDKEEKMEALQIVTEQILKGRWDEARLPNDKELKATHVIKFKIEEGSAKIRTGDPGDEKADYELPIWAGVVPIVQQHLAVEVDPNSKFDLEIPNSVKGIFESK
ncbi:MAG: pyridoxamine 5'-phosphate oxidase family protein, partial [Bacteroidota bacterium]